MEVPWFHKPHFHLTLSLLSDSLLAAVLHWWMAYDLGRAQPERRTSHSLCIIIREAGCTTPCWTHSKMLPSGSLFMLQWTSSSTVQLCVAVRNSLPRQLLTPFLLHFLTQSRNFFYVLILLPRHYSTETSGTLCLVYPGELCSISVPPFNDFFFFF